MVVASTAIMLQLYEITVHHVNGAVRIANMMYIQRLGRAEFDISQEKLTTSTLFYAVARPEFNWIRNSKRCKD